MTTPTTRPSGRAGRHILYVAWGFPPHRGPGTYRPLAAVNALAAKGRRVTVLTTDLDTFDLVVGGDDALLATVDERVRVVRVPTANGARDPVINRWPEARVANATLWRGRSLGVETSLFPEPIYGSWLPRVVSAARRIHQDDPVDLVVATGNPYVDFAAALALSNDAGIPFVLDDRDAWALDVYTGEPSPDAARILAWLDCALDSASQAWFVNPPLADWHRTRFPRHAHKIRVVENGWDPAFLDPAEVTDVRPADRPPVLTYVGTINPTLPLKLLAEGWHEARRRSPLLRAGEFRMVGQFGHAGTVTRQQERIAAHYRKDAFRFLGRRPKSELRAVYDETDVLVFAKEGGGYVTSGKVYEYVATGLPIVSVLEPGHDARRVLGGYPRWFDAATWHPRALAEQMIAAVEDSAQPDRRSVAAGYGRHFRRDTLLTAALADVERELGW